MAVLVLLCAGTAFARPERLPEPRGASTNHLSLDRHAEARAFSRTPGDTTWLGHWTFDAGGCTDEGWVSVDVMEYVPNYFHVDDFAGLGGGTWGGYFAPEGNQSMWCGARPSSTDPVLCGYATLPGYGDRWFQYLSMKSCAAATGDVTLTFLTNWDSEPGYDMTMIQYDSCDDNWIHIQNTPISYDYRLDGRGVDSLISLVVDETEYDETIRLRFRFTSDGAWSDQDGNWNTDGAVIIDSLIVTDSLGVGVPLEDFEDEALGAQHGQDWESSSGWVPYGDFAGLFPGAGVLQEDPCVSNITCMWGFFSGSTYDYACGGYPGQPAVPSVENGVYLENQIHSPVLPFTGNGSAVTLEFDVYQDLPLDNLVFYTWYVRSWIDDCPGRWMNNHVVHYREPDTNLWERRVFAVGEYIEPGAQEIQIALAVLDMCFVWCGVYGTGQCHSHAPLFDNVSVYRVETVGPLWNVAHEFLFQDTFPDDGTLLGTCRADMSKSVLPMANPGIRPGDSTAVVVSDPEHGLATDSYTAFGSAVYAYVSVWPKAQPLKSGAALTDDAFRFPVVDSLSLAGATWYQVRMDTVFLLPPRQLPRDDRFCVDLNDALFTPGDTVCFFFGARNGIDEWSYYSIHTGDVAAPAEAAAMPMEFTCLPAGGDILYVDGMDGLGSQPYFDAAFAAIGLTHRVDRYDVRAPLGNAGNRPSSRVVDAAVQLAEPYRFIIWDTGDLSWTLGNGMTPGITEDDYAMLYTFIDQHDVVLYPGPSPNVDAGIWLTGDDIAQQWEQSGGAGAAALRNYLGYTVTGTDHVLLGFNLSPFVMGETGSCFLGPDTLVAFGAAECQTADYDVIAPTGSAVLQMSYHGNALTGGAVVSQKSVNAMSAPVGMIVSGFSFASVRGHGTSDDIARSDYLNNVLRCFGSIATPAAPPPRRSYLSQNYPNPFNPVTSIAFGLRERAHVTLRIYDVRGALVRTLVDETRGPGVDHVVEWDGTNAQGQRVASGVYFSRLVAGDFAQTKKMVLLK